MAAGDEADDLTREASQAKDRPRWPALLFTEGPHWGCQSLPLDALGRTANMGRLSGSVS